jgi:hypothetical protein
MSTRNFGSLMADMEASITNVGRSVVLWVPEFGWTASEVKASEAPFPPQLLAAYQSFMFLWNVITPRVWVHIAAEMQAGKTGVISAIIRLVLSNKSLGITPHRIFIATGMSDEAWEKQTKERMPECIRANVHHAGTISHIAAKLKSLAGDDYLSNILIFLDESHIATSRVNQPNIHIYRKVEELCPRNMWQERNIRFVTVSATDPAKVLAMKNADVPCEVVRLYTTEEYTSVQKLKDAGRIHYIERVGMLNSESGFNALMSGVRETEEKSNGPLIHIIRPRGKNHVDITAKLEATGSRVISWNAKDNSASRKGSDSASSMSTDINDVLLADKPEQTTFVVLKDMFRAAKTIDTTYIGVMFDRLGANDSTNLQSLLGRACGYGKSDSTIVFTSEKTVSTYINMWRELCSNKAFPIEVVDIPVTHVNRKMPHVKAVSSETGINIGTTDTHASPLGSGVGTITRGTGDARVGDENFEMEWFEDANFEVLKNMIREAGISVAYMTLGKRKKVGEFYVSDSAAKKKTRVISYADLMLIRDGKKTSHITGSHKDKVIGRENGLRTLFIGYRNLDDPTSVVFAVKFAWRKF